MKKNSKIIVSIILLILISGFFLPTIPWLGPKKVQVMCGLPPCPPMNDWSGKKSLGFHTYEQISEIIKVYSQGKKNTLN